MDDNSDVDSVSSKLIIDIDCNISPKEKNNQNNYFPFVKRRSSLLSSYKSNNFLNNVESYKFSSCIGREYQATISNYITRVKPKEYYSHRKPNDILLWKPFKLKKNEIKMYLKKYCNKCGYQISKPADDEDALLLLMKNKYNVEKSLVQLTINCNLSSQVKVSKEPKRMSIIECREFEKNFSKYKKKFKSYIESSEVLKNRQLWELVFFYYVWKKSPRYSQFILKHLQSYKDLPMGMIDHMKFLIKEEGLRENKSCKKFL